MTKHIPSCNLVQFARHPDNVITNTLSLLTGVNISHYETLHNSFAGAVKASEEPHAVFKANGERRFLKEEEDSNRVQCKTTTGL